MTIAQNIKLNNIGFNSLSSSFKNVEFTMISLFGKEIKILESIINSIMIDMMDHFSQFKVSTYSFFNNYMTSKNISVTISPRMSFYKDLYVFIFSSYLASFPERMVFARHFFPLFSFIPRIVSLLKSMLISFIGLSDFIFKLFTRASTNFRTILSFIYARDPYFKIFLTIQTLYNYTFTNIKTFFRTKLPLLRRTRFKLLFTAKADFTYSISFHNSNLIIITEVNQIKNILLTMIADALGIGTNTYSKK